MLGSVVQIHLSPPNARFKKYGFRLSPHYSFRGLRVLFWITLPSANDCRASLRSGCADSPLCHTLPKPRPIGHRRFSMPAVIQNLIIGIFIAWSINVLGMQE